ncbi:restriction endonuclease, partial [[Mycoplasma] falconis]
MLSNLVNQEKIKNLSPFETIYYFSSEFAEHIYALTLSNTQCRRSRAGKEFETIVQFILMGCEIEFQTQVNIVKKQIMNKKLGKNVDFVLPDVIKFAKDKDKTILISAKTTLRERWQEVPEEMKRTGVKHIITLDDSLSDKLI